MSLNPELLKMINQKKAQYSGNNGKTIKPKDGRNVYRLLAPTSKQAPWVGASNQFWADLGVHWIKADEKGKPIAVVGDCDTVYQQPSAINTAIEMAINSAVDEASKKLYESWKARKSVLVNVHERATGNEGVLELTTTTFGKVLDMITLYAEAGQDITDPITGCDIIITKTGVDLNTKYDVTVSPTPGASLTKEQLSHAIDLPDFIAKNYFRGEEQKALNAISSVAGVAIPRLGSGVRTPTAALASPAAAVEGAQMEEATIEAAKSKVQEVDPEIAAKRAALQKRQQEAAAELAKMEAEEAELTSKAEPAKATAEAASTSALSAEEQDSILAELDDLV